jgi:hypothetical protein
MASHEEVAHRWAQDDASARQISGFNIYFERRASEHIIFSYGSHFPVAAFVDAPDGSRVVLFTSQDYSVSTSKHKTIIRRAIPSRYQVFTVPHVSALFKPGGRGDFHGDNLKAYLARAAESYAKAKRARVYAPMHTRDAEAALSEARQYAATFRVRFKVPASIEEAAASVEKLAKAQAKAEAKARAEAEERQRIALQQQQERDAFAFEAWQSGQPCPCPASYRSRPDGTAYVTRTRFEDGSEELRTSQGAAVPWQHAVKAFRFIRLCVERGEGWQRNGRTIRVGHYQIDRIEPNGDMVAGCHRFAWEAMRELAEREGVFSLSPSAEAVETREGVHA